MTLVVRAVARGEIEEIVEFLAERDPGVARKFRRRLEQTFDTLLRFPQSGERSPSRRHPGSRLYSVIRFTEYVVVFRPTEDTVEILRVVNGRRDLPELF